VAAGSIFFLHIGQIVKERKNRYLIAMLLVTLYSSHIGDANLTQNNIYVGGVCITLNQKQNSKQ